MYFARSHKLNTNNMRSLFGMFMVSDWLMSLQYRTTVNSINRIMFLLCFL